MKNTFSYWLPCSSLIRRSFVFGLCCSYTDEKYLTGFPVHFIRRSFNLCCSYIGEKGIICLHVHHWSGDHLALGLCCSYTQEKILIGKTVNHWLGIHLVFGLYCTYTDEIKNLIGVTVPHWPGDHLIFDLCCSYTGEKSLIGVNVHHWSGDQLVFFYLCCSRTVEKSLTDITIHHWPGAHLNFSLCCSYTDEQSLIGHHCSLIREPFGFWSLLLVNWRKKNQYWRHCSLHHWLDDHFTFGLLLVKRHSLASSFIGSKGPHWSIVVSQCPSSVVRRPSCGVNNCFKILLLLHPWANWLDTW